MVQDENKVVVHYTGGKLAKGYAFDFNQDRDSFHLFADQTKSEMIEVSQNELKAVFFVKSFKGNHEYRCPELSEDDIRCRTGMKLKVIFRDGECIYACSWGYSPARKGFFIFPCDEGDNNKKIYVVKSSTSSVEIIR